MVRRRTLWLLRIAVSAVCAGTCLALIVLWTLIANHAYRLRLTTSPQLREVISTPGYIRYTHFQVPPLMLGRTGKVPLFDSVAITNQREYVVPGNSLLGFGYATRGSRNHVYMPHWAFVTLFASLAVAPWIRWSRRFSMKMLFLVTTLVTVLLGLIAVAIH